MGASGGGAWRIERETIVADYPKLRLIDPTIVDGRFELDDDDAATLREAQTAEALVGALLESGRHQALCGLVAFMLPPRERVWLSCLWAHLAERRGGASSKARAAAEIWVRDQSEEARHKGFELAMAEELDTAGAWAAFSAFMAGPSMAPEGADEPVPPPAYQSEASAATALLMTTVVAEDVAAMLSDCAALAIEVAKGSSGVAKLDELAPA